MLVIQTGLHGHIDEAPRLGTHALGHEQRKGDSQELAAQGCHSSITTFGSAYFFVIIRQFAIILDWMLGVLICSLGSDDRRQPLFLGRNIPFGALQQVSGVGLIVVSG